MIKNIWDNIKAWFNLTFLPWAMINWMIIANYVIIIIAYLVECGNEKEQFLKFLLGLWLIISIGYVFYKYVIKLVAVLKNIKNL